MAVSVKTPYHTTAANSSAPTYRHCELLA